MKKSKQKSSYNVRKKGNGYENSLNIHGGPSTINDFNIHFDEENNPDTINFNNFLESFGLGNYMTFFTHTTKHILDLVINNELTMV